MAIAFANLGVNANPDINVGNSSTSYANLSWTPPTDGIILAASQSRSSAGPSTPTIAGNSITWVRIGSTLAYHSDKQLTIFGAFGVGSSAGVTTIDFGADSQVHCTLEFSHVTGADESGTIASAIVQQPTNSGDADNGSVALAAAANSNNRAWSVFVHTANEATVHRTDWTELDDLFGAGQLRGVNTQFRDDIFEATASATWVTSSTWGGMAIEIKAAGNGEEEGRKYGPALAAMGV